MLIGSKAHHCGAPKRPAKPECTNKEGKKKAKNKTVGGAPKKSSTAAKASKGNGLKHYAVKPAKQSARRGKQGKTKLKSEKGQFRQRVSGTGTLRRVAKILRGEMSPREALAAMFRSPRTAVAGSCTGAAHLYLVHSMDVFHREAAPELWLRPDRNSRRRKPVTVQRQDEEELGGFLIAKIA